MFSRDVSKSSTLINRELVVSGHGAGRDEKIGHASSKLTGTANDSPIGHIFNFTLQTRPVSR